MKRKILSLLLLVTACFTLAAYDAEAEREKLQAQLVIAPGAQDSIRILYDIFDVVPRSERPKVAKVLYGVAQRQGDVSAQLDLLRQLTQYYRQDSITDLIMAEANRLPDSREKQETILFLKMRRVVDKARYSGEEERQKMVAKLISQEQSGTDISTHDRILYLFSIVEYLNNGVSGDLLDDYVEKLYEVYDKSHISLYAINNLINSEAANLYTVTDNYTRAVKADRKLLEIISEMEEDYKRKGRMYRNYDENHYIIYRRMLGNYEALTPEEINECWTKIHELAQRNENVKRAMDRSIVEELYYAMATKDYKQAIPLIKAELPKEKNTLRRRRMLSWLERAAREVGDHQTLEDALTQYNRILLECENMRSIEKYKELQIMFDVNDLRAENAELEMQKQHEEMASTKRMMTFVMFGWVIFAVILVIAIIYWARYRRMSMMLVKFVKGLDKEGDTLKDKQYSWREKELSPDDKKKDPYKKLLPNEQNVKRVESASKQANVGAMIKYALNDVAYVASIGNSERESFVKESTVMQMLDNSVTDIRAHSLSQVEMDVEYPDDSLKIVTDTEMAEYIIGYITRHSLAIAPEGKVDIYVRRNKEDNGVEICWWHHNVIVPPGREDVMLDDIIDVSNLSERKDSAMFLCRLISMLLDGLIYLDTDCEEGSRYVFKVPEVKQ